jgi:hypothetical protein
MVSEKDIQTMKAKRKQITCRCPAYDFPHRQGGGECTMPDDCPPANEIGFKEVCGWCEMDDNCVYQEKYRWCHYDPREEALTVQERNPNFRSW